jgi:hypothetical protein
VLSVKECPNRNAQDGRYLVSLINICHDDPELSSRTSYYCDKGHLRTVFLELLRIFQGDFSAAMRVQVDWDYLRRNL